LICPREAGCQVLHTHKTRKQPLHGLDAIGNETPYAVHTSHPATAELLDHLVIADALFGLHIQLSHTEETRPLRGKTVITCPLVAPPEPGRCRSVRPAGLRN